MTYPTRGPWLVVVALAAAAHPGAAQPGQCAALARGDLSFLEADGGVYYLTMGGQRIAYPGVNGAVALAFDSGVRYALLADGRVAALDTRAPATIVPDVTGARAVAAGQFHGVALLADGGVRVWAQDDRRGVMGDGRAAGGAGRGPHSVRVPGVENVVAIAAGSSHTLALRADGSILAWGHNGGRQEERRGVDLRRGGVLGTGDFEDALVPKRVAGITDAVAIGSGPRTAWAIRADGTVMVWGRRLGARVPDPNEGIGEYHSSAVPVAADWLRGAVALSNDLALFPDGTVKLWNLPFLRDRREGARPVSGIRNAVAVFSDPDRENDSSVVLLADGRMLRFGISSGTAERMRTVAELGPAIVARCSQLPARAR
jgi:hypothetical protein